jgi:hypothetical protein
VTDNVSSNAHETDLSLQHAEATILATAETGKQCFSKTLDALGILTNQSDRSRIGVNR